MEPVYIYRAICEEVTDGDTFVLLVDLGFRVKMSFDCRLHGIDVYEQNTPEGKTAAEFVRSLLTPIGEPPRPLIIQTHKAPKSHKDERSFARWVCDVWVGDDSLADLLRSLGFHKP